MLLTKQLRLIRKFSKFSEVLCQQATETTVKKDKSEVYHDQFKIKFKKLQINDKALGNLLHLVKSKKQLAKEEQIVVEGRQLIKEAVEAHIKLNYLLFSHIEKAADVLNVLGSSTEHVNFMKVPQQDLSHWSVLQTCPGLIGIFAKPPRVKPRANALPITVICDNIREPNNVGAVIRLANALPATKVLMPKGCADPWDVKAIRGSSGSIFHIATDHSLAWEQIEQDASLNENAIVLIADNNLEKYKRTDVIPYDELPFDLISGKHVYVIIGGETHGISDEAKRFAFGRNGKAIHIPVDAKVDSLNTSNALAIILFELRRRLTLMH